VAGAQCTILVAALCVKAERCIISVLSYGSGWTTNGYQW